MHYMTNDYMKFEQSFAKEFKKPHLETIVSAPCYGPGPLTSRVARGGTTGTAAAAAAAAAAAGSTLASAEPLRTKRRLDGGVHRILLLKLGPVPSRFIEQTGPTPGAAAGRRCGRRTSAVGISDRPRRIEGRHHGSSFLINQGQFLKKNNKPTGMSLRFTEL